jgi:hypothetical protein
MGGRHITPPVSPLGCLPGENDFGAVAAIYIAGPAGWMPTWPGDTPPPPSLSPGTTTSGPLSRRGLAGLCNTHTHTPTPPASHSGRAGCLSTLARLLLHGPGSCRVSRLRRKQTRKRTQECRHRCENGIPKRDPTWEECIRRKLQASSHVPREVASHVPFSKGNDKNAWARSPLNRRGARLCKPFAEPPVPPCRPLPEEFTYPH